MYFKPNLIKKLNKCAHGLFVLGKVLQVFVE